ncbi:MAG: chemotaxis protein CheA [Candidatus Acidiferrales bacterium]
MNFFSDERAAELREIFFESAEELLQAMNDSGMALEERPDDKESIRRVRRAVHTLKGDSAACGFRELSELAHELEDVLTPELVASKSGALAEVVLTAADTFHAMLAAYRGNMQPPAGGALREHIHRLLNKPASDAQSAKPEALFEWTEYERLMIAEAIGRKETVYYIAVRLNPDNQMPAPAVQLVRQALSAAGKILAMRPEDGVLIKELWQVEAALSSTHAPEWIKKKCHIPSVVTGVVVEIAQEPEDGHRDLLDILLESEAAAASAVVHGPAEAAPGAEEGEGFAGTKSHAGGAAAALAENTLRVDTTRIDTVMNLVGELIIGKSMLHRTIDEFQRRYAKDPLRGKFADALAFQSRVLGDLQKSVMKIRMVPVEQLFRRFPRIVRDVAKQRNKEIVIEIAGQNTDLDKSILDALAEPLAHLVRNAADHGIEPTPERVAAGKPARGTIKLNAYHQGNQVVIEVSDDGHGLDREKIVRRAIERGIVSAEEAKHLNETEALHLIFKPGLSTADEVTEISGRGVGMDVVHTVLEKLKGSITLESEPGKGATFLLMVPLTLASIQALLFRVGGRLYAVPLASVVEITRVTEPEIHRVDQREVLRLRNQILTLVRLDRLGTGQPADPSGKKQYVVVIAQGSRKFGLIVDSLMGEEELVIKALEDQLVASELVSGASILGDGTVVLILNVAALVTRLGRLQPLGAIA